MVTIVPTSYSCCEVAMVKSLTIGITLAVSVKLCGQGKGSKGEGAEWVVKAEG